MNLFRFEISVNGFILRVHHSTSEKAGLENCRKWMATFQRRVANMQMKVVVSAKEKKKNNWEYHGEPYLYLKTLHKKPFTKKDTAPPAD